MKLLFVAIAATAMLFSCNDSKVAGSDSDDHASLAESNAKNMEEIYRAIETGDVSKIDTLLADDVVDHNGGPQGEDIKGREAVKAMLSQIHTYFDNLKMEKLHHATSPDGQYLYSTVRMTGKAKENPWGMPVGMDVDDTSVDVVKLKDGKATEHWGFMSMQDVQEMMKASQGGGGSQPPASADTTKKQ